jgi:hypothetical protein
LVIGLWFALHATAVELPASEASARLCFVRPGMLLGSGVKLEVQVDDARLPGMRNRSYQCVDVPPGGHVVTAWGRFAMVEPSFFGVPTIVGWDKVSTRARLRVAEGETVVVHLAIEREGLRLHRADAEWVRRQRVRPVRRER